MLFETVLALAQRDGDGLLQHPVTIGWGFSCSRWQRQLGGNSNPLPSVGVSVGTVRKSGEKTAKTLIPRPHWPCLIRSSLRKRIFLVTCMALFCYLLGKRLLPR